ncbi:amidohydrolase family protein [Desulfolutivibrio sp.]|uniref:amidohydrolase family protein n=1 Tax=Desulfolutivibrio sp. TaxID=2773296 RepID=UPI002F96CE22
MPPFVLSDASQPAAPQSLSDWNGRITAHVARRVMTMAPGATPLVDAAVIVRDREILAVGPRRSTLAGFSGPIQDHGPATLVPGLINAHCHLELAHLRGAIPSGLGFAEWVRRLVALPMGVFDQDATQAAAREMRTSGTACVADIATRHPGAAARTFIREGLDFISFFEEFGFTPPKGDTPSWPADLHELPHGLFAAHVSVAGHALYSTHPERLRAAKAWAARHGKPFSLHLAEHLGEVALLADGTGDFAELLRKRVLPRDFRPPGRSPVAHADALGLLDEHTLVVHGVHVDDADIRTLAGRGCGVCLCPRSNAYIGVGRAPVEKLAAAGVRLCLGTDSPASNTDLDLWNEVRYLLQHWERFSLVAALAALTTTPARLLGRENSLGMLEPGMRSGVALLPIDLEDA